VNEPVHDDAIARSRSDGDAVAHEEWLLDEAIRGSFPASDPASSSQPGSIAYQRYATRRSPPD